MKKVLITGRPWIYRHGACKNLFWPKPKIHDVTVIDNQFYSSRVNQLKIWGIKFQQLDILDKNHMEIFFQILT